MKILYEDKYLIVCEKPVGVESQRSSSGKDDMLTLLSQYRQGRGEDGYVGLVHRLDTATGGAMIYSKREDITGKLSALVQSGDYKKTYLAGLFAYQIGIKRILKTNSYFFSSG